MGKEEAQQGTKSLVEKYGADKVYHAWGRIGQFRQLYNKLCRKCQALVFRSVQSGNEGALMEPKNYCAMCKPKIEDFITEDA